MHFLKFGPFSESLLFPKHRQTDRRGREGERGLSVAGKTVGCHHVTCDTHRGWALETAAHTWERRGGWGQALTELKQS